MARSRGETLDCHIAAAIDSGCAGMCCVHGWQKDGQPVWGVIRFD